MSNKYGHDITTCFLTPIVAFLSIVYLGTFPGVLISLGFVFAGFMFNGDLDCHSSPYTRWLFLRFLWIPYRWFGSHRSLISHGPVIGTVVRVLWLAGIFVIAAIWFIPVPVMVAFCTVHWQSICYVLAGLELGAASHYVNDWIT